MKMSWVNFDNGAQMSAVRTALNNLGTEFNSVDSTVGGLSTTVSGLSTTVSTTTTLVNGLNSTVSGLSSAVSSLQSTVSGLNGLSTSDSPTFAGATLTKVGSVGTTNDTLTIETSANAASMANTSTALLFKQYYYDASTPASVSLGRISCLNASSMTSDPSSHGGTLAFQVASSGTLVDVLKMTKYSTLFTSESSGVAFSLQSYNDAGANFGAFAFNRSRGTNSAPTNVLKGDYCGHFRFSANRAASGTPAFSQIASFGARAMINVTSTTTLSSMLEFKASNGGTPQTVAAIINTASTAPGDFSTVAVSSGLPAIGGLNIGNAADVVLLTSATGLDTGARLTSFRAYGVGMASTTTPTIGCGFSLDIDTYDDWRTEKIGSVASFKIATTNTWLGDELIEAMRINHNAVVGITTSLTIDKFITFAAIASGSVSNNSLFKDSSDGKLKFKDNSGTVQALY
jgi:trimeric autotransporter adhesin